ncbi:hypothetical protein [Hydrogenophaga pseudoflava]|uniref:hypothetical protein n=1 Tax=Hydrogenophaga pseudoflava TaxID=47421 RepID=UPI0027E4BAA7|nr:hypothetical protein [Hydrogenophaga pseudoflava]MDQ7744829.1 hypothetical protein [Hydrogenophaga pseudoflava]
MKRRSEGLLRTRSDAVDELRRDLQSHSWPRAQMTLLVALTGGTGLLASFLMLQAGVERMALRYPLALAVAYGVFLLLLWLWLRTKSDDWAEIPDVGMDLVPSSGHGSPTWSSGGGGQFGGGGASASFDAPATPLPAFATGQPSAVAREAGGGLKKGLADGLGDVGDALDADELVVPLFVIALAVGLLLSSFYVVYSAPTLFAELLLDGALSASLYRRLRGIERRHWVATALRRTLLPFTLTAVFLAAVGWGLQTAAPGARSLGEALHHATASP